MSDEDNDIDFEVVEQTAKSDDDNDVYVKYFSPSPNSPVQSPLHPRKKLK